jgi:hypothetical protein
MWGYTKLVCWCETKNQQRGIAARFLRTNPHGQPCINSMMYQAER